MCMKRPRYRYESQLVAPDPNEPAELDPLSPTGGPLAPEPKPKYHSDTCFCSDCCDIRAAMDIYLKAKRLENLNGF